MYVIMKTMCPHSSHHNGFGFVATYALGHETNISSVRFEHSLCRGSLLYIYKIYIIYIKIYIIYILCIYYIYICTYIYIIYIFSTWFWIYSVNWEFVWWFLFDKDSSYLHLGVIQIFVKVNSDVLLKFIPLSFFIAWFYWK